jgi:hypothetical protein
MMRKLLGSLGVVVFVAAAFASLHASAPSGAIFTTIYNGTEVNYNIYQTKDDVYLDGGPGPGAPTSAAGLDPGTYVFQVTDPSGKTLLSTDDISCRQFTVDPSGVIASATCHVTGSDLNDGGVTVQLIPYLDTPNPGGEYKVWVTLLANYCTSGGCNAKSKGNSFGFAPRYSKTDNFKVKSTPLEGDTTFQNPDGSFVDGVGVVWTDTLGASNNKYSYLDLSHDVHHEAHVEALETGIHQITLYNQALCTVGKVAAGPTGTTPVSTGITGPQTVSFYVAPDVTWDTFFIRVQCQ